MYGSPWARAAWAIIAVAGATGIVIVNGAVLAWAVQSPLDRPFAPLPMAVAAMAVALILLAPLIEMTLVPAAVAAWAVCCRRNLDLLPEPRLRWSSAWAACGWFIPVASLFVPLLCLREMWSASAGRRPPHLLLPWWAIWITRAFPVTWVISGSANRWPSTLELILVAMYVAAGVVSCVGAMIVVLRITLLQETRLRPLQVGSAPPPTWSGAPQPAQATAIVAIIAIVLATLGGTVMLAANTISLALGSFGLVLGPAELVVAWGIGLAIYALFGQLIGMLATAVWARRAYRNLPALGAASLGWSPGWATAAWFIPVANLAIPYLVVRDTWPGHERALLRWWWAAWLSSLALGAGSNVLHLTGPALAQLAGDLTGLAGDLALLPAGVLAVVIILTITRHQIQMTRAVNYRIPAVS